MSAGVLMVRGILVVVCQQVFAEVAVEVAPDAMDVIGAVLRVVVFDEERAALHAVVVAFAFVQAAHPGKFNLVEARFANFLEALACLGGRLRAQVLLNQGEEGALLIFGELAVGDAFIFLDGSSALV